MRLILAISVLFLLAGCGLQTEQSTTFSKPSSQCVGNVNPKRYLVNWADGHRSVEIAETDEKFIEEFVKPNQEKIKFAEPDYLIQLEAKGNNSPFPIPSVDNWGVARIRADELWQQGVRGQNVVVAIIDTGVDVNHPALSANIAYNSGESGVLAQNGVDDDGNGYVDDYAGYDFVHGRGLTGDNQYHGTHVAGIIAAAHHDTAAHSAPYVQGVAPETKILPLAFLNSQGSGNIDNAVRAIDYAVQRGAKVINASWGGSVCSRSLREKVASLKNKGVIFVAAAGNSSANIDQYQEYPAAFGLASQFTVGSSEVSDSMAEHSNYGQDNVHIFAPGSDIVSTVPGDDVASLTGTSMATPFVTGAIALLLSAEPSAQVEQIRAALYESATHSNSYLNASHGRLDLANALSKLQSRLAP